LYVLQNLSKSESWRWIFLQNLDEPCEELLVAPRSGILMLPTSWWNSNFWGCKKFWCWNMNPDVIWNHLEMQILIYDSKSPSWCWAHHHPDVEKTQILTILMWPQDVDVKPDVKIWILTYFYISNRFVLRVHIDYNSDLQNRNALLYM
jgi:hypothetical protein